MFRRPVVLLFVLLSLASALALRVAPVRPEAPVAWTGEDFQVVRVAVGDYSYVLVDSLMGSAPAIEGRPGWSCAIELGVPNRAAQAWIHPVELICRHRGEDYIWPLGEGVFRRAFAKQKLVMQGEAARLLSELLTEGSDFLDVESPLSSREVAWGPSNVMKISSLRKSAEEGDLKAGLECYSDEKSLAPLSCALLMN